MKPKVTRSETHLVEPAAADGANRESEERVILSQELSSASVESGGGSGETETSTDFVDREVLGELADREDEESQVEESEDGDQGDVNPQGCHAAKWIRPDGLLQRSIRAALTEGWSRR